MTNADRCQSECTSTQKPTCAEVLSLSLRSRLQEFSEFDGAARLGGHWRSSPHPVSQIATLEFARRCPGVPPDPVKMGPGFSVCCTAFEKHSNGIVFTA